MHERSKTKTELIRRYADAKVEATKVEESAKAESLGSARERVKQIESKMKRRSSIMIQCAARAYIAEKRVRENIDKAARQAEGRESEAITVADSAENELGRAIEAELERLER